MRNFPPVRTDLKDFEVPAASSVDVIVRIRGWLGNGIGRYFHGMQQWQVNGVHSHNGVDVVEWWPMPEIGTGNNMDSDPLFLRRQAD